jgi:serine/threonine protein kinase
MMDKRKLDFDELKNLRRELSIMQNISHPHVVRYLEAYEDKNKIWIVMENCSGGELNHLIEEKKPNTLDEKDISIILGKML